MAKTIDPFRLLLIAEAGWMNHQQQQVIDYLREENRVLREQLGTRPPRFDDDQRRRLAVRAKALGRRALTEVATIVTPDTLLRWHRKLIGREVRRKRKAKSRQAQEGNRIGDSHLADGDRESRLGLPSDTRCVVESRTYCGALYDCQHPETARDRTGTGAQSQDYLEGVLDAAVGTDRGDGLLHRRSMDASRAATFPGALLHRSFDTPRPNRWHRETGEWTLDEPNRSRAHRPWDRLILLGEGSLRKAVREFVMHYHLERNHQGLGNQLIAPEISLADRQGTIRRRQRLGGMLNYYHLAA